MASCQTPQWAATSPYVRLTVTQTSSTATNVTLTWTLEYIASSAANTSVAKSYTVKIGDTTVKTGTYNIDGKKGTHTIASGTRGVNKGTSAQSVSFSVSFGFNLTWSGVYGGTKTASGSISVAAKTSYSVKYNANGGTGAPSAQTKWHATPLALSTTKPTRTGHVFQGWGTSASDTSVNYDPGDEYTANEAITLYAIWKANTYSITYNANGGTGAPATQTKTYGVALTLSSTKPTRTNYTFKGWGASATATTVVYSPGDTYKANTAFVMYAIWELSYVKPRITGVSIRRCTSEGVDDESGLCANVTFAFQTDLPITSYRIRWKAKDDSAWSVKDGSYTSSVTAGTPTVLVGNNDILLDNSYDFQIIVSDDSGSTTGVSTLSSAEYVMDILAEGKGIAFGKTAERDGYVEFGFDTSFSHAEVPKDALSINPGENLDDYKTPGYYVFNMDSSTDDGIVNLPIGGLASGSVNIFREGDAGQVRQVVTRCSEVYREIWERLYYSGAWKDWYCVYKGGTGKILWSGGSLMNSSSRIALADDKRVSQQPNGIVLVFSRYSSSTYQNYHFQSFFISKEFVADANGYGNTFLLTTDGSFGLMGAKYIYVNDDELVGNDINTTSGTGECGIKYNNGGFALRYVIGV